MPVWVDTRGKTKIAIGICARCSVKMPYSDLREDGNYPGLFVCDDDWDELDRWRLPARETEDITLDHPRPDVSLSPGPMPVYTDNLQAQIAANPAPPVGGRPLGTGDPGNPSQHPLVPGPLGAYTIAIGPPVKVIQPPVTWTANTAYIIGAQVTAVNPVGLATAGQDLQVFLCIVPGLSGATPPAWNNAPGVITKDHQARWLSFLYLP